jgi:hypothetical protein
MKHLFSQQWPQWVTIDLVTVLNFIPTRILIEILCETLVTLSLSGLVFLPQRH